VNIASGSQTFSGILRDNGGTGSGILALTKDGVGTQVLTGTNTYTGTTTVTNGALQIGNAGVGQTGSGAVTVASGGTILGTGTVRGNTFDLQSGSTLRPGDGVADSNHGTLTFTPASASGSTSNLQGNIILGISTPTITDATFGGNVVGSVGYNAWADAISGNSSHDRLIFGNPTTGTGYNLNFLTTTGSLQVQGSSFTPAMGQAFNLLDWSNLVTTNFSGFSCNSGYLTGNGDEGTDLDLPDISSSGLLWDFSRFTTSGVVVVVPEPSRALLILFGLAGLMLRRRRL
jgi:autotransporter-associated beta strand protein